MSIIHHHARNWGGHDPEHILLAAMLHRAVADAIQLEDERLQSEAWEFLDSCAPYVAARLRRELPSIRAGLL